MWFLLPAVATGVLLLRKINQTNETIQEENVSLDYRRIYICHSFCDTKSYKKVVRKLKLSEEYKVWNHSIPQHKQRKVKDDDELREVFKSQMRGCSHVFVLATSGLPRKSYVRMEIEVAQELGKRIIAIRSKGSYYVPPFIKKANPEYISNDIRTVQKALKK